MKRLLTIYLLLLFFPLLGQEDYKFSTLKDRVSDFRPDSSKTEVLEIGEFCYRFVSINIGEFNYLEDYSVINQNDSKGFVDSLMSYNGFALRRDRIIAFVRYASIKDYSYTSSISLYDTDKKEINYVLYFNNQMLIGYSEYNYLNNDVIKESFQLITANKGYELGNMSIIEVLNLKDRDSLFFQNYLKSYEIIYNNKLTKKKLHRKYLR